MHKQEIAVNDGPDFGAISLSFRLTLKEKQDNINGMYFSLKLSMSFNFPRHDDGKNKKKCQK